MNSCGSYSNLFAVGIDAFHANGNPHSKLLAQNRLDDLIHLKNNLITQNSSDNLADETFENFELPMSDHLTFITGLALMKTSTRLDELIYSLQRLNFQKNGHYFLLLCQCLLYSGNHDTVVALCKQTLNKEINSLASPPQVDLEVEKLSGEENSGLDDYNKSQQEFSLQETHEEKMLINIAGNNQINDPRLWFTFGLSLEFQRQFADADLVYRVACKLAGQITDCSKGQNSDDHDDHRLRGSNQGDQTNSVGISNYYTPHRIYSEFCVRYQADYRTSIGILSKAAQKSSPINYTLNPALALTLCSQANSNASSSARALELMNSLDNHSISLRNPSFVYNQLALTCKQKLGYQSATNRRINSVGFLDRTHEDVCSGLDYVLIKSHIVNNEIVRNSLANPNLYKCPVRAASSSGDNQTKLDQIFAQIDKTLETLRRCNTACWASYALWNNLGVFYLLKRRYIASLSCLRNANRINPTDWRINYNLSIVYSHVSLPLRSLCCSLAADNFRPLASTFFDRKTNTNPLQKVLNPLTGTMIAISYYELDLSHEARRFYTEIVADSRNKGASKFPLLALVNYLLLLHENASNTVDKSDKERNIKSIISLLDLIEQAWLQRSPNDSQFANSILALVNQIGQVYQQRSTDPKRMFKSVIE